MVRIGGRYTACLTLAALALACGGGSQSEQSRARPGPIKIGFLLDNTHERWERDRELFVDQTNRQGFDVVVEFAESDQQRQIEQADKMLADGVKVLVVVPHDQDGAATVVEHAKAKNVPVISYDRLIRNADVDLYITFDNVKIGELQASALLAEAPKGNYVLIGGSQADSNAHVYREGQLRVLQPAIDKKEIRIVHEGWATDWKAEEAARLTEEGLEKAKNRVAAILTSNDVTAGAAIDVLSKHGLAGKVAVSGQDAELAAVRRIVAGTQTMTVYKPLRALTRLASAWAVRMAEGAAAEAATTTNNGFKDVPTMIVDPIALDNSNIAVLINDGYHTKADIYGGQGTR